MTIQKVLAPVADPSQPGVALEFAVSLARPLGAAVTLLHVLDGERPAPDTPSTDEVTVSGAVSGSGNRPDMARTAGPDEAGKIEVERVEDSADAVAERQLIGAAERISAGTVPVAVSVTYGEPAERILSVAHIGEFDLIVMEGVRSSRIAKMFLGSTVDDVEQGAGIPVIILQPDDSAAGSISQAPDAVIVSLDREPESEHAVPLAQDMAAMLDVPVTFVHAMPTALVVAHPSAPVGTPVDVATDADREEVEAYLARFVEDSESKGLRAAAVIETGDAVSAVQTVAADFRNPLIATGSSDRSGIARLVLGRTHEDLVHGTSHPVLVMPRPLGPVID